MDAESMMMPQSRRKGSGNKVIGSTLGVTSSFASCSACLQPSRSVPSPPHAQSTKDSVAAALILARYYDEPQLAVYVWPLSF